MTIDVTHMHRMRSSIYIAIAAFFAGVYGMNFREPKVTSPWGYPEFWLASVVIIIAMLLYFRRKQWILQSTTERREKVTTAVIGGVLGRSYSRTIFRHRKMAVPPSVYGGPGSTHCM